MKAKKETKEVEKAEAKISDTHSLDACVYVCVGVCACVSVNIACDKLF